MPEYRVSGRITTANYDESPVVDGVCNKKFPRAHTAGFGYLFLWFCSIHGYAYEFHLIQDGEGCKTPLAHCTSTWKHHQEMFSMTLLANYQNIASTGNQNCRRTQGSGMTFFMQ